MLLTVVNLGKRNRAKQKIDETLSSPYNLNYLLSVSIMAPGIFLKRTERWKRYLALDRGHYS
jgi:hypothetical protein